MLRQVPQVLAHLLGAGGAVDPDHVGAHRVERHERRADLGAGQHAPGELDGDLHLDGQVDLGGAHGGAHTIDRGLGAEQVELRLDDEQVDAAVDQAERLLGVEVTQFAVPDLTEGREPRARTHRPGDESLAVRGRGVLGGVSRDAGGDAVQLTGAVREPVLAEGHAERSERVGLDHVGTGGEVLGVQPPDHVGSGLDQDLVAALQVGTAEVIGGEALLLEPGAGAAVEDDHALVEGTQVRVCGTRHVEREATGPTPDRPNHPAACG